jgi:mRNA interferase MazF
MMTPSTISYRRGDIVLVSFPFTDLTFAKRRPALVVSPDIFNEINEDLILLAVTSQLSPFPHSIPVLPGDCEEGALPQRINGQN